MRKKWKHLKPDRPLNSIIFSDSGKVRRANESLSLPQDELELVIGKKFVEAMGHFKVRNLTGVKSGSGNVDLFCYDEKGSVINIQVVEVINQKLRQINEMRDTYSAHLKQEYSSVLNKFSGCVITLVDDVDTPYLPRINSIDGKLCAEQIATWLSNIGDNIHTLECKKAHVKRTKVGRNGRIILAKIERFVPAGKNIPVSFSWTGAGPVPRNLLSRAIKEKIERRYPPLENPFWLLAYSTDTLLSEDDLDIHEAAIQLDKNDPPFDNVWYIFPYANRELGHIVHVWPTPSKS